MPRGGGPAEEGDCGFEEGEGGADCASASAPRRRPPARPARTARSLTRVHRLTRRARRQAKLQFNSSVCIDSTMEWVLQTFWLRRKLHFSSVSKIVMNVTSLFEMVRTRRQNPDLDAFAASKLSIMKDQIKKDKVRTHPPTYSPCTRSLAHSLPPPALTRSLRRACRATGSSSGAPAANGRAAIVFGTDTVGSTVPLLQPLYYYYYSWGGYGRWGGVAPDGMTTASWLRPRGDARGSPVRRGGGIGGSGGGPDDRRGRAVIHAHILTYSQGCRGQ